MWWRQISLPLCQALGMLEAPGVVPAGGDQEDPPAPAQELRDPPLPPGLLLPGLQGESPPEDQHFDEVAPALILEGVPPDHRATPSTVHPPPVNTVVQVSDPMARLGHEESCQSAPTPAGMTGLGFTHGRGDENLGREGGG